MLLSPIALIVPQNGPLFSLSGCAVDNKPEASSPDAQFTTAGGNVKYCCPERHQASLITMNATRSTKNPIDHVQIGANSSRCCVHGTSFLALSPPARNIDEGCGAVCPTFVHRERGFSLTCPPAPARLSPSWPGFAATSLILFWPLITPKWNCL